MLPGRHDRAACGADLAIRIRGKLRVWRIPRGELRKSGYYTSPKVATQFPVGVSRKCNILPKSAPLWP